MAKKYNNTLRFRDSKKELVFHGKFGNEKTGIFDYTDGGKKFADFSEEEIAVFAQMHNAATVQKLMIGTAPALKAAKVSDAPKIDK